MSTPAPAEKVLRQTTCAVCGDSVQQPRHGRPRVLCQKVECFRIRHNQRQRGYRIPLWSKEDEKEALDLWQGTCGACLKAIRIIHPWPRFVEGIVPVHVECAGKSLSSAARTWRSRCFPGVPLPDPWKGGR